MDTACMCSIDQMAECGTYHWWASHDGQWDFCMKIQRDPGQKHLRQAQFVLTYVAWAAQSKEHAGGWSLKHVRWVVSIPNSVASGPLQNYGELVQCWGSVVGHLDGRSHAHIYIIKLVPCKHILMYMRCVCMWTGTMVWMWTFGHLGYITVTA